MKYMVLIFFIFLGIAEQLSGMRDSKYKKIENRSLATSLSQQSSYEGSDYSTADVQSELEESREVLPRIAIPTLRGRGYLPSDEMSEIESIPGSPRSRRILDTIRTVDELEDIRKRRSEEFKDKVVDSTVQYLKKTPLSRWAIYFSCSLSGVLLPVISFGLFQLLSNDYHRLVHHMVCDS